MTRPPLQRRPFARAVFMTLAALAVALKVMIPAGFMTAPDPRNGLPFALVLCTGEGAKLVQPGEALTAHPDKNGGADKSAHDAPCPFASHGAAAPPPSVSTAAKIAFVAYAPPVPPARITDLAPGRGLAAPPLPARGPPSLLI